MSKKKRVRRHRRKGDRGFGSWAVWKQCLVIVGVMLVFLTTAGVVYAASKLGKIETTKLDVSKLNISAEVEHNETGYLNVALFGLDSRDGTLANGERSDTIIIASLNRETKEIRMCSVYRDTLAQQGDSSYNKINAAYSFGGPEGAVAALNKNLDLDIQHYVSVNFNAMVDVVDELGGIEVDLTPEEVFWTNGYSTETSKVTGKTTVDLTTPGKQKLDGVQATAFCRIRKTTGDDFRRTERQRTVLEQIIKKAQTADLSAISRIIDKVFPKVGTNFTLTEILAYAKDASKYKVAAMSGFPFDKSTASLSGVGSSVVPESLQSNVAKLHKFFFGDNGYMPSSTVVSISSDIRNYATKVISTEEAAAYESNESTPSGQWEGSEGTTQGNDANAETIPNQGGTELPPESSTPQIGGPTDDAGGTPGGPGGTPEGNLGGTPGGGTDGSTNQGNTTDTN